MLPDDRTKGANMTSFTSRYGDLAVDYRGAHAWAYLRHAATIVAIKGRIDSANVERLTEYALRFVTADRPFALDLTGLTSLTAGAAPLLAGIADRCGAAGTGWALVAGESVQRRLPEALSGALSEADLASLPLVATLAEAEHQFDEAIQSRRRALLSLVGKKTA